MTDGIGSRVGTERGLDTATSPPADVSALDPRDELEDVLRRQGRSFVDDGPPFRKPMKLYADTALRLARNRTHRRIGRSQAIRAEGAKA